MTAIAELVPVNENDVGGEPIQTVNARDLHLWLESRQDFSTWIKKRIDQYGFTENEDFSVLELAPLKNGALESTTYKQGKIEYYISLDMAKELSMVERNAKGKEARTYFINCEKQLKTQTPATYLEALKALVAAEEAKQALERDNQLLNTIIDNEFGYCSILRAAKHLGVHEKTFKWQTLKKDALAAGLEIKKVPSPRFEYQLLYPIVSFERCYPQFDFSGLGPEQVAQRHVRLLSGHVHAAMH